jgi:hypothetical protein
MGTNVTRSNKCFAPTADLYFILTMAVYSILSKRAFALLQFCRNEVAMRFHSVAMTMAFAGVALGACSTEQARPGVPAPPPSPSRAMPARVLVTPNPALPWQQSLFIADAIWPTWRVKLFANGTWAPNGYFGVGTCAETGLWSDQRYLYVVTVCGNGDSVREYSPNNPTPVFTYTNGVTGPANVSTQIGSQQHVFITNDNGTAESVIEFQRDTNTVLATCYPGGNPFSYGVWGVAIDSSGNVFVDIGDANGVGHIVEYVGGLSGCNGTLLPVTLGHVGYQMVIDNVGRLIIARQSPPAVEVVNPPYTSVSGTLGSGYIAPYYVTINSANTLAFVSDGGSVVKVLQYPSGNLVYTFFSPGGPDAPAGVVEWNNYGY